jgi:hypothetical protein
VHAAEAALQIPEVLTVGELGGRVEGDTVRPGVVVEQLYELGAGA